jgi:D-alanyl-D-alanine-carboxypeptidase/D-alanyl-D-alanine-endopeptidase
MRIILFLLFISFSMNAQFTAEFKASIQERVDNGYAPSIAVGVLDSSGVHFYNYGKTKNENGQNVDQATIYEIGSISKVFTSLLLAEMIAEGKINLDDPIEKYLPNVQVPDYKGVKITFRHLSTHNSGLPRLPDNIQLGANLSNPYAHYDEKMLLDFLGKYKLPSEPGTKHEYSNLGAGLIGYILTKQSGMTLEELFYDKVGKKIFADNTKITLTPEQKEQLAVGHMDGEEVPNWDFQDALAGCGAFKSTVSEMLSFLFLQLNLDENDRTVAIELTQELQAEVDRKMGLGWHFYKENIRWHNGGTGGYKSFCGIDLEKNRGVVVLSNSTYSVDDLGLHLLDKSKALQKPRAIAKVDAKIYEAYVGKYILGGMMAVEVTAKDDKLFFQPFGQPAYRIYPESDTLYFMLGVDVELEFVKDENEKVNTFIFEQNSYKQEAKRVKE